MSLSVLSQNLKTIRKNLHCTQVTISKVLDIGLRTYARYEAGKRDVPVAVIVKFARLGSLSLDRLLTAKLTREDLKTPDIVRTPVMAQRMRVVGGGIEEGRVMFMGLINDHLVTTNKSEKKLLTDYRKLDRLDKEICLVDSEWILNNPKTIGWQKPKKKTSHKTQKLKNKQKLMQMAKLMEKSLFENNSDS